MRNSKIYSALFISFLSVYPVQLVNSCAWDEWDLDDEYLKPLDQALPEFPDYFPFLYSEHYWYHYDNWYYYEDEEQQNDVFDGRGVNLEEWSKYFGNKFTTSEISDVIYDSNLSEWKELLAYLGGKSENIKETWHNNPLVAYWKNNKTDPAIEYWELAKEIEPHVAEPDWWDTPQRDTMAMAGLKIKAIKGFTRSKDPFLQLRYLYQAMRMAHYTGNYQECINLYDQNVEQNKTGSVIKYWCLSLKAGAYWRMKRYAESSYFNSLVFDQCPSRRLYAERDFWIDDETTWQKCLAMCKSDHEKNILWLLTGINQNNSAIPALHEMLKLEPSSKEIELLLAREIEKMQRNYMPLAWYTSTDKDYTSDYAPEANDKDELFSFIKDGLDTKKVRTPSFWYSAAALIQLINKNYGDCDQYCELADEAAHGNQAFTEQARILRILNKVEGFGKINPQIENELMDDIKWLHTNKSETAADTYRLAMFQLMNYYKANNDLMDEEMCRAAVVTYYDIYEHPDMESVDRLYSFFTDKNKRPFQDFIAAQYPYNADDMLEIKGTLLMQAHKWEDAVAAFSKMENKNNDMLALPSNPFLIHTWDCHDCDFADSPSDYTKITFAEEMIRLENKLKEDPQNKAEIYHLLGNAYYNITHFGNSWMAIDYYLATSLWEYMDVDTYEGQEFLDCSKAAEYYQKAIDASKDKEFRAMNTFMLAKCEQNRYYESDDYDFENTDGQKENYRTNFAALMRNYKNTAFYKQAIEECRYFDYYVSTH